jgi:hypothetical protein
MPRASRAYRRDAFDPNRTFLRPHLKRSTRDTSSLGVDSRRRCGPSAPSSILRASRQDALYISSG